MGKRENKGINVMGIKTKLHRFTKLPVPKGQLFSVGFDCNDKPVIKKVIHLKDANAKAGEKLTSHDILVNGSSEFRSFTINNGKK